jgi:hypothetical protein
MPISHKHTKFEYPDYIAPLPAADLVKIALKKQELYDQGVAQIQSQVDNYASLRNNIYTDAEKSYFDETMKKYVTAVNGSAGLDFSKKSNLNAVLNIGKPLEKDKNIITAIQNGKEIQRRQKELSDLDQSKRSAANDWFYMNDVSDYLNANKLGVSLSKGKQYQEFYDISDKVMDYVKTLSKEQQDEFFTTGDGTPTGYIQKISQQGFQTTELANRIKGMLSTDPKAMQQLEIDTRYNFNNLGRENAYQGYIEDMTVKEAAVDDQIQQTSERLNAMTKANESVKSPTANQQIKVLQQNLTQLQQMKQQLSQNSNKSIDQFNMNDFYETYQNRFITNLANTYATQKVSRDLKNDKVWDQVQKINLENRKAAIDIRKEKAKARITDRKPENLLKRRTEYYKAFNIDVEDIVNVPDFFSQKDSKGKSIFDLDLLKGTIGNLIDKQETILKKVPAGGTKIKTTVPDPDNEGKTITKEYTQKDLMEMFLNQFKDINVNDRIIVTTKDGLTVDTDIETFRNSPLDELQLIQMIAVGNPYSEKRERRKGKQGDVFAPF